MPIARRFRFAPVLLAAGAALAACHDTTTEPVTPPDNAIYDLVFEQSAFPLNASDLRLRRQGGTEHDLLFGQQLFGIEPSASADGGTIVYQGYGGVDGDDSDLWIVRTGQAPQRVPLPAGDVEYAPALSPDGTRIAFIRRGDDGNTQLWVSDVTGGNRRQVSTDYNGASSVNGSPDWSPDGQRLAWSFGLPGAMRIAIARADGSGRTIVSSGVANGSDIDADWSPDAKQVAFIRTPSPAASDLVVLTLATNAERVFGLPFRNRQPAWAPNGATIVFASTMADDGTDYELYSVKPDGDGLARLTNDDLNQKHPTWLRRR